MKKPTLGGLGLTAKLHGRRQTVFFVMVQASKLKGVAVRSQVKYPVFATDDAGNRHTLVLVGSLVPTSQRGTQSYVEPVAPSRYETKCGEPLVRLDDHRLLNEQTGDVFTIA